ncbi:MAG TPA: dihydropyrimidinase [Isosphaeraceae bacterium]|jgi:dihydropyrimidinase|nr:dihydropyrimidinase [Isosphaeraceae bacterium]
MIYDTIIANGTVVSAGGQEKTDVAIRGETIAAVGPGLAGGGATVIDASGKYVIPGGIDVHVHLELPFCGTVSSDDWRTGTRAAARGGVTTVIDFAIPYGEQSLHEAFDNWMGKASSKACVDYCFHIAITNWDRHGPEMEALVNKGCPTFKEFMIYASEGWQSDDRAIFNTLEQCKRLGAMLLVHAESSRVLDELIARHHTPELMQQYGARLHAMTRPNFIEAEAIQRAITWAEVTGGRLYIVHMSTAAGADLVKAARARGVDVYAETCAQYLVLDDSLFARPDGHLYACCPQVKKKADQDRLWEGLRSGEVAVVSTDTCTFTQEQKARWEGDWTRIPMGLPGLETLLPIVFTHGVRPGRLSLQQLVAKCSTNPARLMGLFPQKGIIAVGSDADIVIIDPAKTIKVDPATMETNADWNPYEGWPLGGFAETTFCRGRKIVDNYTFVGESGWGRWLPRERAGTLSTNGSGSR